MDKQEFGKIAAAIKVAYPNFTVLQDNAAKDVWYTMLADIPYSIAQPATLELLSSNKYPPSIAEFREKCTSYTAMPTKDYGEAWGNVLMAIRKFGYMQELEALDSLDETTRKCVKMIGYQNLCMSENITADRANFRMIYDNEATRAKNNNQIPLQLRNQKQIMLDELTNITALSLESKKNEIHESVHKEVKSANMDKVNELMNGLRGNHEIH